MMDGSYWWCPECRAQVRPVYHAFRQRCPKCLSPVERTVATSDVLPSFKMTRDEMRRNEQALDIEWVDVNDPRIYW